MEKTIHSGFYTGLKLLIAFFCYCHIVERVKKYYPDALYIATMHNVRPIPVNEILNAQIRMFSSKIPDINLKAGPVRLSISRLLR